MDPNQTYQEIASNLTSLLEKKEKAYGNAFSIAPEILKILYPDGIEPYQYDNLLTITRILDKIVRITNEDTSEDPWFDIAGYCFLAMRATNAKRV